MILVRCPDCHDHVRMPEGQTSSEAELRCPLCNTITRAGEYLSQLPPTLQVVELEESSATSSESTFLLSDLTQDERDSTETHEEIDSEVLEESPKDSFTPQPAGEFSFLGSQPSLDSFDVGSEGLQPRPRRRPPSVIKMLVQWVGGGVLGIGIALGILIYLRKVPEFIPYFGEHYSRTSSPATGEAPTSTRAFVPRGASAREGLNDTKSKQSSPRQASSFVESNENSELLASIDATEPNILPQDSTDEPSLQELNAEVTSVLESRISEAAQNLEALTEYEGGDKEIYRDLAIALYESLALVGESSVDHVSKVEKRELTRLMDSLAEDRETQDLLRRYAPYWIGRKDRTSSGIVLLTKIANRTQIQQRAGYRSALVQSKTPITVFGRVLDILPNQGKDAIILGAIQSDLTDIQGTGILVHVAAVKPL